MISKFSLYKKDFYRLVVSILASRHKVNEFESWNCSFFLFYLTLPTLFKKSSSFYRSTFSPFNHILSFSPFCCWRKRENRRKGRDLMRKGNESRKVSTHVRKSFYSVRRRSIIPQQTGLAETSTSRRFISILVLTTEPTGGKLDFLPINAGFFKDFTLCHCLCPVLLFPEKWKLENKI